jgi:hypothetical protein
MVGFLEEYGELKFGEERDAGGVAYFGDGVGLIFQS